MTCSWMMLFLSIECTRFCIPIRWARIRLSSQPTIGVWREIRNPNSRLNIDLNICIILNCWKRFLFCWFLTFLMLFICDRLNFTAMAIAGALVDFECVILNQMTLLIHVTHRPIGQLAIVNYTAQTLGSIAVTKMQRSTIKIEVI